MTCSFVAQRAQKVHLYMVLCNVPFRPKGPKKYIIPTMLNMFLLGPLSTRSHRTSKSCPLDLLGYIYINIYYSYIYIYIIILWGTPPNKSLQSKIDHFGGWCGSSFNEKTHVETATKKIFYLFRLLVLHIVSLLPKCQHFQQKKKIDLILTTQVKTCQTQTRTLNTIYPYLS